MRYEELTIEGRNAVLEAFRSGKTIDKAQLPAPILLHNVDICHKDALLSH